MDGSLFRWQTATGFNGIVKCISEDDRTILKRAPF